MLLLAAPAFAQFVPQVALTGRTEGWVVLADGTRIEGTFKGFIEINEELRFSITDAQGQKHKIRGRDVVALAQQLDPRSYLRSTAEALQARGVRYREWHLVSVPDGEPTLLPLLNPGFDDYVRVYPDPLIDIRQGRSAPGVMSQISVNGVNVGLLNKNAGSFLALPKGEEQPLVVVRATYEELWDRLFGGCTNANGEYFPLPDEIKVADFESHVWAHHQHCSAQQAPSKVPAPEPVAEPAP